MVSYISFAQNQSILDDFQKFSENLKNTVFSIGIKTRRKNSSYNLFLILKNLRKNAHWTST